MSIIKQIYVFIVPTILRNLERKYIWRKRIIKIITVSVVLTFVFGFITLGDDVSVTSNMTKSPVHRSYHSFV